ncbi:2-nitropropane dioxygenase, partial [Saccharophagus degradans]|nr:2-nitropropane dioxygenase [Saccharophagus degradans]
NETNTGLCNDCCLPIASGQALLEQIRIVRATLDVYKVKLGSLSVFPATKDVIVCIDLSYVDTLPPL